MFLFDMFEKVGKPVAISYFENKRKIEKAIWPRSNELEAMNHK